MKKFGMVEIALGLSLVGWGLYLLLENILGLEEDRHGWLLVFGNIGIIVGGLLAFAGAMFAFTVRWRWVWHLPFLIVLSVISFGFKDVILSM